MVRWHSLRQLAWKQHPSCCQDCAASPTRWHDTSAQATTSLLQAGEGTGLDVESVLIPVVRSQGQRQRTTLCISSQVGCAMNCQFCFTGRMGLK